MDVQMPDGRLIQGVPEGITKSQLLAKVQKYDAMQGQTEQPEQEKPSIGRTIFDQGMQGATFGFSDEVQDRIGALIASKVTGHPYKDLLHEARTESQDRLSRQMQERPVTSIASNIAGGALTAGAAGTTSLAKAGAGLVSRGGTATKIGAGALTGATGGALYGAGTAKDGERAKSAATGAAIGGALGAAFPAAGAIAVPKLDQATKEIGKLAQKYKIPVSINELSGSRVRKTVQKVSQELPFSGEEGYRNRQLARWNNEVLKTTGETGPVTEFTPKVMDRAFKRVGGEFDAFTKGKTFTIDDDFVRSLDALKQQAKTMHSEDAIANFDTKTAEFLKQFSPMNEISGEKLAAFRADVNETARKATVEGTSELMHDLENSIIDLITNSSPAAAKGLSKAKYHYKNLIAIEPLAQKAVKGNISPQLLAQRVAKVYGRQYTRGAAGSIGDLARIGRELLPSMDGSDTAQKAALMMAAKKVGTTITAGAAATALPGTFVDMGATAGLLGANRAYQSLLNRNPLLVKQALK